MWSPWSLFRTRAGVQECALSIPNASDSAELPVDFWIIGAIYMPLRRLSSELRYEKSLNAFWTGIKQWLDQHAVALADDVGDQRAGIVLVEDESRALRRGATAASQSSTRLSQNISRGRH